MRTLNEELSMSTVERSLAQFIRVVAMVSFTLVSWFIVSIWEWVLRSDARIALLYLVLVIVSATLLHTLVSAPDYARILVKRIKNRHTGK